MIDIFDRRREEKKVRLISQRSNLSSEEKYDLWVDIKFLNYLVDEIEEFLTWPFNYKQLVTLIFSFLIISLLTFSIFGFLELISRVIET